LTLLVLFVAWAGAVGIGQRVDVTPSLVQPSLSGRDIFDFYCATCHGREGRGGGPVAAALRTIPADLTTLAARNGGRFPRERVRDFVTHGRADPVAHGSADMPVWGPIFEALDASDRLAQIRIDNVVSYVESLQKPGERSRP
jgi:mono/diheme cytochrome c family protein